MKTTVDIPDDVLKQAMKVTGATTKREAIVTALQELNRRAKAEALLQRIGQTDGFMTQAEHRAAREGREARHARQR